MFYYPPDPKPQLGVFAVRYGKYKAHFFTQGELEPHPVCGAHDPSGFPRGLEWVTTAPSPLRLSLSPGSFLSSTTPDHDCYGMTPLEPRDPPLLYDLESDPAENYNLLSGGAVAPEVLAVLQEMHLQKTTFDQQMKFGESQTERGTDPSLEPCCTPQCQSKPSCCHCRSPP